MTKTMKLLGLIGVLAAVAIAGYLTLGQETQRAHAAPAAAGEEAPMITLYKSPNCTCCSQWAEHLRENGFEVTEVRSEDLYPMKDEAGIPRHLFSCHTGMVDGYAIEGHVPAELVWRLLDERPEGVEGIAVPGMPAGSPGMEIGNRTQAYDVIAFGAETEEYVFDRR